MRTLREATGPAYWVEQVDIQADIVAALALCAEDQAENCVEALRQAAAREDATEKHVVTPGPLLPAREILADILLEQDRPEEALAEYEAVLDKEPNRYRALAGAAQAAQEAGETDKARAHAEHLIAQVGRGGFGPAVPGASARYHGGQLEMCGGRACHTVTGDYLCRRGVAATDPSGQHQPPGLEGQSAEVSATRAKDRVSAFRLIRALLGGTISGPMAMGSRGP